ncbi:MAG: PQQ-binding-like beta-propeller repeat protein, partial [Planctomycetes bacterium]|nr:PQQ-binding-like beta-propeller repeat protein [Planctomycetota bacterium]
RTTEKKAKAAMVSVWEQTLRTPQEKDRSKEETQMGLLTQMWIQKGYQPVDEMGLIGDRVWVSSPDAIQCIDKKTGRKLWSSQGKAPFETRNQKNNRIRIHHRVRHYNFREATYFEDRIGERISVFADTVFRTEGNWETTPTRRRVRKGNRTTYITERKGSYLSAYDARNGKRRWTVGGGQMGDKKILSGCRFMNAPVPCGPHALVAIEKADGLYMVALDPRTGAINWQEFLCAYTSSPIPPKTSVGVAVDAGEVYVATGKGVVFALDGVDGHIHWASTYEGTAPERTDRARNNRKAPPSAPSGWTENAVFPTGRNVVVIPADASRMLFLDRSSGVLQQKKPRQNAESPLGLVQNSLIVAGQDFIRAHNVHNGKVRWKRKIKPPTGRGLVARNQILIPQKDSIAVFATDSGKQKSRIHVGLTHETPIGNLYSDGNQIYCAGLSRVFALSSGQRLLAELNQKVADEKTAAAYLARGKFYFKTARFDRAVQDLRRAHNLALNDPRQVRFNKLTQKLRDLQSKQADIRSQLAWFGDSFNRESLGPNYTVVQGNAAVTDGHLKMEGGQQMVIKFNKQIPGNFSAEFDGWQLERPCDLSFKLDIKSPDKTIKELFAQFGANWNVRNILQFDGHRVCVTKNYLIEKDKKHHVKLVKIGQSIKMYADGREILEYGGEKLPASSDTQTTLHFYGFGKEHFFDNFVVKRLDEEGHPLVKSGGGVPTEQEKKLKEKLARLKEEKSQTQQSLEKLREKGYADLDAIRVPLFESLLKLASESPEKAPEIIREARDLARSAEQKSRLLMVGVQTAMINGDTKKAAGNYAEIIEHAGSDLIQADPEKPALRVAPPLWAKMKLTKLGKSLGEKGFQV